ncbi:MAG: DUF2284 domain-containing protein [bacterium]
MGRKAEEDESGKPGTADAAGFQPTWRAILPERQDRKTAKIRTAADPADLERLAAFAAGLGAGGGVAIPARQIVTSEVMRMKCRIPTCLGYGSSFSCPPHAADAAHMQAVIREYEWALLVGVPLPDDPSPSYEAIFDYMNRMKEIVGRTEVEAQYAGYVNAMGFTGGPCGLCGVFSPAWMKARKAGTRVIACPVLARELPFCAHYHHCRPAARAVGIDIYATARAVGWEDRLSPPPPVRAGRIDWPCLAGVYPILIV